MNCPVCHIKAKVIDTRHSGNHFTTTRIFECEECLTRFKSSEKIIFSSIPAHVRNHFLDTGRRKLNE